MSEPAFNATDEQLADAIVAFTRGDEALDDDDHCALVMDLAKHRADERAKVKAEILEVVNRMRENGDTDLRTLIYGYLL